MTRFTGWIVRETADGPRATFEQLGAEMLDDLDTSVRVHYSSINYEDALALQDRPGVVRRHPLVAGIDVTGEVLASGTPVGGKVTWSRWTAPGWVRNCTAGWPVLPWSTVTATSRASAPSSG
ncbi:alcohol dehydrogenase catalytic domain-containing protein [Streptomyces chrestomyceticus]|uniref:alcohol dehydrogenase catalytic domain-containing protein n=1 Tax=Streptomyces chrestomyceticus TaxID=68185 RepID=UPI0037B07144